MKKTLLAVSFGTTHADAEAACIRPVEDALRRAFPDWQVRRAWTARFIVRRLRERGEAIETEAEALERLWAEGGRIAVAATHIIPGEEYERLLGVARGLPVSKPLLAEEADLDWMAALLDGVATEEGGDLLVMGHGTEHRADETYARLRAKLQGRVHLACVEGGCGLEGILPELERVPGKRLTLMPLMLVAGDHAKNDLAGDGDSWKTRLEARGFNIKARLQGLGSMEAVQRRFVDKARAAVEA